ncbi:MAG: phosphatase PAP2 family protein [Acidimicrobiia bacterium]
MSIKRLLPAAVAGGVLVATTVAAKRGVPPWEHRTYSAINDLPDALAPLVWPPMQFGSLPSPFALGAFAYRRNRRPEPAASIIAAGFAAWIMAKGMKKLVGRGRPHDFDSGTNLRLWTEIDGSLGFVSGHVAVAMASAGIIHRYVSPGLGVAAYGLAAVVGFSRIYAGAHLPIDVLGGAALGVLVSESVIGSKLLVPAGRVS